MTDFWETLLSRSSIGPKHQRGDTVLSDAARKRLIALTAGAPAHGPRRARLAEIRDREALACVLAGGPEAFVKPDAWQKAREKAGKGALCWMLVLQEEPNESKRNRDEALVAAGAMLMRLLDGLHALGLAAKTVSAKDFVEGAGLFDPERETVLAFVLAGEPQTTEKCPRTASAIE